MLQLMLHLKSLLLCTQNYAVNVNAEALNASLPEVTRRSQRRRRARGIVRVRSRFNEPKVHNHKSDVPISRAMWLLKAIYNSSLPAPGCFHLIDAAV